MNKPSPAFRRALVLIAFAALCLGIVLEWTRVCALLSGAMAVFRPILLAIVIAFFVNLPMRLYERWLHKLFARARLGKKKDLLVRALSMLLAFLTFLAVIVFAVWLLYPQLRQSVTQLIQSLPAYERKLVEWSQTYLPALDLEAKIQELYQKYMTMDALQDLLSNAAPHLFSLTSSAASMITDFVLALMLSFYLLLSKNKLVRHAKNVLTTYAPRLSRVVLPVAARLNDKFRRFLGGQLTEAIILGMLCFIGMTILSLPYAPLVSTLVAVTAVIPIFGAYIGAIVSAFIILMDNPLSALIFLVFLVVLQQVEGNLIYPRVVGDSIGLSGLWVLLAVIVGGGFFGIPGIFVGIPVMSVLYDLVREDLARRRALPKS
ncbi:MAG: AI-2E family transporter [Candidatus Spyradocola sp.]